ncbi:zinc finger protein 862-like [Lingula anatina]|uniref:Zinc finger protein 862-like n=1 Tax=Lingula anatina TaxID=7574 RepID=A0A2R2MTB0_LINAN|nr:zinc finger protein 862-like [Lingula anatina]|eukprot:XP_023933505.1 zinc finger protein 862-like [Lingula anatina]
MIDGSSSFKLETIKIHERSKGHLISSEMYLNLIEKPAAAPALKAHLNMTKQVRDKMNIKFRNIHAVLKNRKSFRDYMWLCDLDEAKGLEPGETYRNQKAAKNFAQSICDTERKKRADLMKNCFFTIISDGSTDCSITEQEIVYVRYAKCGQVHVDFVGLGTPSCPDADGIFQCILKVLKTYISCDSDKVKTSLVGFGCDGASVMLGKYGGVASKFRNIQPSIVVVHCVSHRLELAYKDSIKKNETYEKAISLLMGVYYFYKNSPKMRQCLRKICNITGTACLIPARVGGTRWIGHLWRAVDVFLKMMCPIFEQMSDVVNQKSGKESKNKARGFLRWMTTSSVIGYLCLLKDVLKPLHILSNKLQATALIVPEVPIALECAKLTLEVFKDSNGPTLENYLRNTAQFNGVNLNYPASPESLTDMRYALVVNILKHIDDRLEDLNSDTIAATKISCFKLWPEYSKREELRVFGNQEVATLVQHFKNIIPEALQQNIEEEWISFRSAVYSRYKDDVHSLSWPLVWREYHFPAVQSVIDICLTLPSSSAEAERGFSVMKRTKTDGRACLQSTALNICMSVDMLTPSVRDFDPTPAVEHWLCKSVAPRRPLFMENKKGPQTKAYQSEPSIDVTTSESAIDVTTPSIHSEPSIDLTISESSIDVTTPSIHSEPSIDLTISESIDVTTPSFHSEPSIDVTISQSSTDVTTSSIHSEQAEMSDSDSDEGFDDCYSDSDEDNEMTEKDVEQFLRHN